MITDPLFFRDGAKSNLKWKQKRFNCTTKIVKWPYHSVNIVKTFNFNLLYFQLTLDNNNTETIAEITIINEHSRINRARIV